MFINKAGVECGSSIALSSINDVILHVKKFGYLFIIETNLHFNVDAPKNQLLISAKSFHRSEEIGRAQMENQEIVWPAECFSIDLTSFKMFKLFGIVDKVLP